MEKEFYAFGMVSLVAIVAIITLTMIYVSNNFSEDFAGLATGTKLGDKSTDFEILPNEMPSPSVNACVDTDGDGYGKYKSRHCRYSKLDCDDLDYSINPRATEICGNSVDENCDGLIQMCPNIAPIISITNPQDGASFRKGSQTDIEVTASDVDGYITHVEIYRNETLLYDDLSYPYGLRITNDVAGSYKIVAKAFDDRADMSFDEINIVVPAPTKEYRIYLSSVNFTSGNVMEFDLFFVSYNITRLSSYQILMSFNQYINGAGNLTFSYVPGSSQFTSSIPFVGIYSPDGVKELAILSYPGSQVIYTTPLKIGHFKLTNTINFTTTNHQLMFNFEGVAETIIVDNTYIDITDLGDFSVNP
ncbi:MAG: Ig-like domain-containing protein [Candidatus Woesearchaeota archaeon]